MTEMVYNAAGRAPGEPLLPRWWRTVDKVSLAAAIGLFLAGILLGLAASPPLAERNDLPRFYYVWRQVQFGSIALCAMLIVSFMSPAVLKRWAVLGFFAAFAALILLPVFGTDFGKGAVRWYSLGFASVQPSEFLKPCFVVFAAWLMSASFERNGPPGIPLSFGIAVTLAVILVMQPDYGQAALITGSWAMMYFVAGAPMIVIMVLGAMVFGAGVLAYNHSDHVQRRIDGFLNTEIDPTTQIGHASSAIREGGVFGVGAGGGEIKRTLPDAHTDFIIAVAAEEYGLVLCFVIIALFLTIVLRALASLLRERDPFVRLAGVGLAAAFGLQAMINLGVTVRLLPAKGMTLPFVSYGGSSLVAVAISLGMLLALTRRRPQDELEDVFGADR